MLIKYLVFPANLLPTVLMLTLKDSETLRSDEKRLELKYPIFTHEINTWSGISEAIGSD